MAFYTKSSTTNPQLKTIDPLDVCPPVIPSQMHSVTPTTDIPVDIIASTKPPPEPPDYDSDDSVEEVVLASAMDLRASARKQLTPTLFNRHVDYILGKVPPHYSVRHKNITELITHVKPRTVKKKELSNPASTTPPTSALPNTSEATAITLVCAKLYATWFNIISHT